MTGPEFTTNQAREQLDQVPRAALSSATDRKVYAVATALSGVIIGCYVAFTRYLPGGAGSIWGVIGYVALFALLYGWQTRTSRAIPRGAKRTNLIAMLMTVALMLVTIIGLNVVRVEVGLQWWHSVLAAIVVALPCLVAGRLIATGERG